MSTRLIVVIGWLGAGVYMYIVKHDLVVALLCAVMAESMMTQMMILGLTIKTEVKEEKKE